MNEKSMRKAYLAACAELEEIRLGYLKEGWQVAYGTSGTMKAVAQLVAEDDGGAIITLPSLEKLIKNTVENGGITSSLVPKLRRGVLPAGLVILQAIFTQLKIDVLHVADATLKEGLVFDTIGRFSNHDSRIETVGKLQEQYGVDKTQAYRVSALAKTFWLRLEPESNKLPGISRTKILEWAAQLHEVGLSISHSGYHEHGYYILRHSDLAGFGRYEQYILANLVRYHRKKLSTKIEDLDDPAFEAFVPLLICLRLSARIQRRREDLDKIPTLHRNGSTYTIKFAPHWLDEHPLTQAGLEQEASYFKGVGIKLEFG